MSLQLTPDAEAALIAHLGDHPAIQQLNAEVVSRTPGELAKPWVKVTQLDAPAAGNSRTDRLIAWWGAFDCYAGEEGDQETASTLVRTVRAILRELGEDADPPGLVVTGVKFDTCARLPDSELDEMERYQLTATLWLHA